MNDAPSVVLLRADANKIYKFKDVANNQGYQKIYIIDDENNLPKAPAEVAEKYMETLEKDARARFETEHAAELGGNISPRNIDEFVKMITGGSVENTVILGTNLIATGIDAKPRGQVARMVAVDTVFDKNHDVAKQFVDRTGRDQTLGIS